MRIRYLLIVPAAFIGFAAGLVITGMLFDVILPTLMTGRDDIGAADQFMRPGGIIGAVTLSVVVCFVLKRVRL